MAGEIGRGPGDFFRDSTPASLFSKSGERLTLPNNPEKLAHSSEKAFKGVLAVGRHRSALFRWYGPGVPICSRLRRFPLRDKNILGRTAIPDSDDVFR